MIQTSFVSGLFKFEKAKASFLASHGDVIINELMWTGSPTSASDEWVELKNNSISTIDFSVTQFSIYKNDVLILGISSGSLAPGGYFLISNFSQDNASSILNVAPDMVDTAVSLSNTDAQYKLYASADNTGTLIDTADDGSGAPLAGDNTNKYSMERNSTPGDGTLASNWHTATSAVNFDSETTAKGTPKAANSEIVSDTTAPVITLLGSNPVNTEVGSTYVDAGATASDNIDGNITANIISSSNVDTNLIGTYTVTYDVTDSSGNAAVQVTRTVNVVDTIAPTGSITINKDADVTNGQDWQNIYNVANAQYYPQVNLDLTHQDNSIIATTKFQIKCVSGYMKLSNEPTLDVNGELIPDGLNNKSGMWLDFADTYNGNYPSPDDVWKLSQGNGIKHVYAQFKDEAGNISPVSSDKIFYSNLGSGVNPTNLAQGLNSYINGNLKININANTPTTLFVSTFSGNPLSGKSGINFLNKYYDFSVANDANITFPVRIEIHYTAQDLIDAGITDESKIQGLYYYDFTNSQWKLYTSTGVETSDVLFNGAQYAGYVWANADHFTPVTPGADITAPAKPTNFTANSGDGQVSLSWDKVNDASSYSFRYRKSTSIDNTSYVTVNGLTSNSTTVTGLANDTEYEFGVASADSSGNTSDYAVVNQTPHKVVATTTTTTSTSKSSKFFGTAQAAESTVFPSSDNQAVTTTPSDNGEVKSSETNNDETEGVNWSRLLITLGILLLAVGAGFGGYYGYQWWIGDTKDNEKKNDNKTKDKDNNDKNKDKGKGKGGRW